MSSRTAPKLLAALVAALLTTAPLLAQAPSATGNDNSGLEAIFTDATGAPLPGLRVVLSIVDGDGRFEAYSDPKGAILIEGLPYGYYKIAVERDGQAYPGNRVLLLPPGRTVEAEFELGAIQAADRRLEIREGDTDPLVGQKVAGTARLVEQLGPSGWAWFKTGKGVAVLVGGGALLVGGIIALSDDDSSNTPVSPSTP